MKMGQVSLPCQYHSTIIPYSFSIHLSVTPYAHRKWQHDLWKCLPHSNPPHLPLRPSALQQHWRHILEARFTPITLRQLFFYVLDFRLCPKVAVNCALLCYYAVSSSNFLLAFQNNLSVPYSEIFGFLNPENWTNSCPETSVRHHHYSLQNTRRQVLFFVHCYFYNFLHHTPYPKSQTYGLLHYWYLANHYVLHVEEVASTIKPQLLDWHRWRLWLSSQNSDQTMGQMIWNYGSIPNMGNKFFFPKMFRTDLGTTQPPIQWVLEALSLE
jgi:hypothetical protein